MGRKSRKKMRIQNIPHDRENSVLYELEIIGKKELKNLENS
jgi:hypothetical protein